MSDTPPTASSTTSGEILADLPCISCGYNLRGLTAAMNCPECAMPVLRSIDEHGLARAGGPFLRRLARACTFRLIAIPLEVLSPILIFTWVAGSATAPVFVSNGYLGIASQILVSGLSLCFIWMLTTPIKSVEDSRWPQRVRQAIRIASTIIYLVDVLLSVQDASFGAFAVPLPIGTILYPWLAIAAVIAQVLYLRHLVLLARNRSLGRWLAAWAFIDAPVTLIWPFVRRYLVAHVSTQPVLSSSTSTLAYWNDVFVMEAMEAGPILLTFMQGWLVWRCRGVFRRVRVGMAVASRESGSMQRP